MSTQMPVDNSFIVENENFAVKTFDEFIVVYQQKYNNMARIINKKDYGSYTTTEVLCSQERFNRDDLQQTKTVYRKVIDIGALLNNGAKSILHGINVAAGREFIRIYGVANDPTTGAIPLPYTSANPIYIDIDATHIIVTTTDDKTAFTVCTVTVEYIGG